MADLARAKARAAINLCSLWWIGLAVIPEIEILFFGKIADRMGRRRETQALSDHASLFEVRDRLFGPEVADVRMSVNQVVTAENCLLRDGDEVAFFSIFSGG